MELRRLWLALDGPKWTYTEEALKTGDQWFSGSPMAQWCNISVSTDHSLKGVSIQSFMVPADGILHYNIWSKFKSLETFEVTY
ncbi:MAG TPA: hypothetical protein VL947_11200, partial [Cytophagales bacterium]|nr:hypothetical protein [Cytophagales bacterium]